MGRVIYAIKGGTLQRNFDDGSTIRYTIKTGEVIYQNKPEDKLKYSVQNVGKSPVTLQGTFLK